MGTGHFVQEFGHRVAEALSVNLRLGKVIAQSKSAACKLDYDARVCPWNDLKEAAERGASAVTTPQQSLLVRTMSSDTLTQATLPGPLSGFGLRRRPVVQVPTTWSE